MVAPTAPPAAIIKLPLPFGYVASLLLLLRRISASVAPAPSPAFSRCVTRLSMCPSAAARFQRNVWACYPAVELACTVLDSSSPTSRHRSAHRHMSALRILLAQWSRRTLDCEVFSTTPQCLANASTHLGQPAAGAAKCQLRVKDRVKNWRRVMQVPTSTPAACASRSTVIASFGLRQVADLRNQPNSLQKTRC